jgi:hypothetical protein
LLSLCAPEPEGSSPGVTVNNLFLYKEQYFGKNSRAFTEVQHEGWSYTWTTIYKMTKELSYLPTANTEKNCFNINKSCGAEVGQLCLCLLFMQFYKTCTRRLLQVNKIHGKFSCQSQCQYCGWS